MQVDSGFSNDLEQSFDVEKMTQQNSVEIDLQELVRERALVQTQLNLHRMIFKNDT